MAKRSSDSLHQLIKSLTGNEKRYFKMYMQKNIRHDNKIFDVLFDAIDKQEEYDERALIEKFRDKSFSRQFPLTKTRLYEQILRSLDALYADSSVDAELKQNLHFVEILFRKTLYKQAEKLLYHTKKKALKHEKISSLIEISLWQKRLLEKSGYAGNAEEEIGALEKHDRWLLLQLGTHNEFWTLKSNVFSILNKSGKTEELTGYREELMKKFSSVNYNELTVENKFIYHHTLSAFYFGLNDYENCYLHLTDNAKLISENALLFRDEPNVYFSVLSNLIFICNRLGKNEEAIDALRRLKNVNMLFDMSNNEDLQLKHFNTLSSAEITLYRLTGNYAEALRSIDQIEHSLEKFREKLNPTRKASYFINLSAVYLANGKFSQALKWCNELLNDKSIDENEKLRGYALVLSMLIHYDLGHRELLPVIVRQLEKQFFSAADAGPFFGAFIEFASRVGAADKEALSVLLQRLQSPEVQEKETHAFEFFDFCRWANSRLSGIPFTVLAG